MTTHQTPVPVANVVDPVCGMTISPADAAGRIERDGQTYYFCSNGCLEKFKADPARYTGRDRPAVAAVGTGAAEAEYTCPMHPQVRQKGPGSCPICGMALEP